MKEKGSHTVNAEKTSKFDEWMLGDHALVHLDSRRAGVEVPDNLKNNPSLTLKLSYLFSGETTHDESGITTYLKFGGNYSKCVLPWSAVWGMTSAEGKQMVWPKDMPNELLIAFAKQQLTSFGRKIFRKGSTPQGTTPPQPAAETTEDTPQGEKPKKGLRRVK